MMYTVWMMDDAVCEDTQVFEGTLTQCREYVEGFEDECYIVEPDGFTVVE